MTLTRHFQSLAFGLVAMASLAAENGFAFALPLGSPGDGSVLATAPQDDGDGAVDFTAIVALSNCSGSLVRFTTSRPDDKAMVFTNGHCFEGGFIDAGKVVTNRASTRTFRLLSSNASSTLATLRATTVLYATMTDTDVTIYRLTQSYADIERLYGVQALIVSDHRADAGAPMRVVSGYWKRIYSCNIDDFVYALKEDTWTFKESIRYTQPGCETIGGTSGSPVVHADTHEVIGINNTGNENGQRCTMNNPCEVNERGEVNVRQGAAYGQQLYLIYTCLTDTNAIDLTLPACALPKGT